MDYIYYCMLNLDKELKRAREEMQGGSLDNAVTILAALRSDLEKQNPDGLPEEERFQWLVKVLNNLGVVQKNSGAFEPAAESLERALEIADLIATDTVAIKVGILSNIGLLYSRRKLYNKGLEALDMALKLSEENPGKIGTRLIAKLRNNRALFYVRFGEPQKAREELAQSIEPVNDIEPMKKDFEREAWLTANLAMIHAELGNDEFYNPPKQEELYRQARSMFLTSARIYGNNGYAHHHLKQLINVAEMDLKLHSPEEAKRHLIEAQREATMLKDPCLLCEIAHVNVELALQLRKHNLINDRVEDAMKLLYRTRPADLSSRVARLEGVLARNGSSDALQIVTGYKSPQNMKKNSHAKTAQP
jgi:tetratricopeptide (TPR) repeat protein